MWLTAAAGIVLAAAVCLVAWLTWRRLRLLREGGVDVALRTISSPAGRGWQLGIARYRGDEFAWFRILNLRSGPQRILLREDLEIAERRTPTGVEIDNVPPGSTILRCRGSAGEVEIAMTQDALTGFLSWLESAPPGRRVPWVS